MKKFKIGQILTYVAFALMGIFVIVTTALAVFDIKFPSWAALPILVYLALFFTLLMVGSYFVTGRAQVKASKKKYKNLPYREVADYKSELEKIRENYQNDKTRGKNTIPKLFMNKDLRKLGFSVLNSGKIYYGFLVEANSILFSGGNLGYHTLPAVFIYSTDEYYESNPRELEAIADRLYADRANNFLANEKAYFYNVKLNTQAFGNRDVYATTVFVYRPQLPSGYISDRLVPLIADPMRCDFVYVIDEEYWTKDFACYFAHCNNWKKQVDYELEKYANYPVVEVEDFADELEKMKEAYVADASDRLAEEGGLEDADDEEIGKSGLEAKFAFNYAYVTEVNRRDNDPYLSDGTYYAVALVSDDNYFKQNPYALGEIAQKFKGGEPNAANIYRRALDNKNPQAAHVRLPFEITGGREVDLCRITMYRYYLPTRAITHNLLPVVKFKEYNETVDNDNYVINKQYWSQAFLSCYLRGSLT